MTGLFGAICLTSTSVTATGDEISGTGIDDIFMDTIAKTVSWEYRRALSKG